MFGLFKDTRRRAMEAAYSSVGAGQEEIDEDYGRSRANYSRLMNDLNDLGMGVSNLLDTSRAFYKTLSDLGDVVDSYYNGTLNIDRDWAVPSSLRLHEVVGELKAHWNVQDDVIRRSVAQVVVDSALNPLRNMLDVTGGAVNSKCEERDSASKDYAHYKRKILQLQDARMHIAPIETAKLARNDQDMREFSARLAQAGENYDRLNVEAKTELLKTKIARDELLEIVATTLICAETELLLMATRRMEALCSALDRDKADRIRTRIRQLAAQGGPEKKSLAAKTDLKKAFDIATGKAVPGDFAVSEDEVRRQQIDAEQRAKRAREIVDEQRTGVVNVQARVLPKQERPDVTAIASATGPARVGVRTAASADMGRGRMPGAAGGPAGGPALARGNSTPAGGYNGASRGALPPPPSNPANVIAAANNGDIAAVMAGGGPGSRQYGAPGGGMVGGAPGVGGGPAGMQPRSASPRRAGGGGRRAAPPLPGGQQRPAYANSPGASPPLNAQSSQRSFSPAAGAPMGQFLPPPQQQQQQSPPQQQTMASYLPQPGGGSGGSRGGYGRQQQPEVRRNEMPQSGAVSSAMDRFRNGNGATNGRGGYQPPPPTQQQRGYQAKQATPPPRPTPPPRGNFVVALYDNVPDDADEVAFVAGDRIEVLDKSDPDWWRGRVERTGNNGVFPSTYIRPE